MSVKLFLALASLFKSDRIGFLMFLPTDAICRWNCENGRATVLS